MPAPRSPSPAWALRVAAVRFSYPGRARPALDGVTLGVRPGEGVALLGPNGAGKTTLTRLAMALLHPAAGEVESAGLRTRGRQPEDLAHAVGYCFQQPEAQLFARTVRDELAFGPRQLGWSAERIDTQVDALLEELELTPLATQHPYDLPAPARRLVALGAAVVAEPQLLLLDEPTAGLDRRTRALVERVVRARRAAGCAVVAVTHDIDFSIEALGRAIVLEAGRIVRDAPLEAVLGEGDPVLALPPHALVARRLALAPASAALADVARALAAHCRPSP